MSSAQPGGIDRRIDVGDIHPEQFFTREAQGAAGLIVGVFEVTVGRVDPEDDVGRVVYGVLGELETLLRRAAFGDIAEGYDTADNLFVPADCGRGVLDGEASVPSLRQKTSSVTECGFPSLLVRYIEHCSKGIFEPSE